MYALDLENPMTDANDGNAHSVLRYCRRLTLIEMVNAFSSSTDFFMFSFKKQSMLLMISRKHMGLLKTVGKATLAVQEICCGAD